MTRTQETISQEDKVCAKNYAPLSVVLNRGEGVWLWDIEGNRYLDMMSAYSAVSHGHCHPKLLEVLRTQSEQLCVTSRAFHHDQMLPFLKKVCDISKMDMALPMNSGAEAVETAIKAARRWGYQVKKIPKDKAEIIVAKENFHGRTISIISFSSDEDYKKDFGPLTPGFVSVPFGDINALKKAITPNTCAVLFEPIQGESGIHVPPVGFLKEVRKLCTDNHILMILDEIQSGLGRTGKLFAYDHENIQPDGLILGKALGGGILPVSCFLAKKEVMALFNPGSHGSTFGGNPLACAVGKRALELMEEEGLVAKSENLGNYLMGLLEGIKSRLVKGLRGRGLWIGMEIDTSKVGAKKVCEAFMKEGVLTKEAHERVIRIAPPLVITKEECDWGVARIITALEKLV